MNNSLEMLIGSCRLNFIELDANRLLTLKLRDMPHMSKEQVKAFDYKGKDQFKEADYIGAFVYRTIAYHGFLHQGRKIEAMYAVLNANEASKELGLLNIAEKCLEKAVRLYLELEKSGIARNIPIPMKILKAAERMKTLDIEAESEGEVKKKGKSKESLTMDKQHISMLKNKAMITADPERFLNQKAIDAYYKKGDRFFGFNLSDDDLNFILNGNK